MKKTLFILLLPVYSIFTGCSEDSPINIGDDTSSGIIPPTNDSTDITVDLKMPGTLAANIPNISFKSLKIKGDINGTDIKFLRGIISNLDVLDLEDANIVEGGDSYYNLTYKTENNIVGRFMFADLKGNFELILPKSIVKIDNEAFLSCVGLRRIKIWNNVTNIEQNAFCKCINLIDITLPDNIEILNFELFRNCSSLESIKLPTNLKEIDTKVFAYCTNLSKIQLPVGIKKIGSSAFMECKSLKSINLPNTIEDIEYQAFYECSSLSGIELPFHIAKLAQSVLKGTNISSITIPEEVVLIEDYAFKDCKNLKEIFLPKNVTNLGFIPFSGCTQLEKFSVDANNTKFTTIDGSLVTKDKSTLVYYPCGKSTDSYTVPNEVSIIGDASFFDCNIQRLYIHSNVTEIKERAFSSTIGLSEVHCKASNPPKLGTQYNYQAFPDNVDILYVPAGSGEIYKKSIWARYFNKIQEE